MTRRRILILFVVMVFIAITTTIFILKEPACEPNLDIVLRCGEGVSGTLSVTTLLPDSDERQVEESFDVEAACEEIILGFGHYISQANILFAFKHNSGKITRLISEYGTDIQVDNHHGFYVGIRILNAPPFLANDRI